MKKDKKKAADTLKEVDSNLDIVLSIITKLTLGAMGLKTLVEIFDSMVDIIKSLC